MVSFDQQVFGQHDTLVHLDNSRLEPQCFRANELTFMLLAGASTQSSWFPVSTLPAEHKPDFEGTS
jgi:hypothetical protein